MRSLPVLSLALFLLFSLFGATNARETLAQDAPPATASGQLVQFVESSEFDVSIPRGDGPATMDITVRNLSDAEQAVAFCFLEPTPTATCADSPVSFAIEGNDSIAPHTVATLHLSVTQTGKPEDLSGFLVTTVSGQVQDIRPVTLTHEGFVVSALHVLAVGLLFAVIFTFARKTSLHGARKRPIVDNPSFKGWATAVTVATGIGAPLLKEFLGGRSTLLPGREFAILGIFFALMIFIAPLIYGLNTKPADSNTLVAGENTTTPPIMGTWGLFWVSIALSVWAFTGTAITIGLYIADAWDAGALSFANTLILAGACLVVVVILALHSWQQIDQICSEEPLSIAQITMSGVTDIQTMRVIIQPQVRRRFSGL
jgi:hypothetical protein